MNPNQISIIIYDLVRRLNVVAKTKRVRLSEVYRWAKEQKDWGSFLFFPDHQSVTDCKKSKVRIFWTNGSVAIEGDTWLAVGEECAELLDASGIVTVDDRYDRPLPEDLSATGMVVFNGFHKNVVLARLYEARNAAIAGLEEK